MRTVASTLLVALLLLPGVSALSLLAAPSHDASSSRSRASSEAEITDPEGDAYVNTPDSARSRVTSACGVGNDSVAGQCAGVVYGVVPPAPDGIGTPAPPGGDLLSVAFRETAAALVVTMEVAKLDEATFGGLVDEGHHARFVACWTTTDEECTEFVDLFVAVSSKGTLTSQPDFGVLTSGCSGWYWCDWAVEADVTYGSPGTIEWSVPRALLPNGTSGTTLRAPSAYVSIFEPAAPPAALNFEVRAAGQGRNGAFWGYGSTQTDFAGPGRDVTLRLESDLALPPSPALFFNGDVVGGNGDPRATYMGASFIENETTLTAAFLVAEVEEAPSGIWNDYYLAMPNGWAVYAYSWLSPDGAETRSWIFPAAGEAPVEVESTVTTSPGTPGWINVTWSRIDLGSPRAGELMRLFGGDIGVGGTDGRLLDQAGAYVWASETTSSDWFGYAPPIRLKMDTKASGPTVTTHLRDLSGDAVLPSGVFDAIAATYDITGVDVRGLSPTETKITLTIADLAEVKVPTGQKAVLYAVAAQTADGGFMAGYYKDANKQVYFCSQDVDVLVDSRRDPNEVVWVEIQGIVRVATGSRSATGTPSNAGSISLIVPHSCFGIESEGPFEAQLFGAGTYLIGHADNSALPAVQMVDEVEPAEAVILGASAVRVPDAPWWVAPFGFDAFWNIFGLVATGTGGLIALFARRHRKNTLQRELEAVEHAHATQRGDAAAWKGAMGERRKHSAELLRRGKLRADELLVVERRIELLSADVAASPAPTVAGIAPGTVLFERYRVERLLGEGGQGRAFLATDTTLHRDVVLKTVSTSGLDANAKRLILAEARLAASIKHPNVVPVLDVRDTGGEPVLILEYVEGGSLRDLLARQPRLAPREAVRMFRGILSGLAAAHERGIVHRDVKPENVLLARDGTPKLGDFGAAREARPAATVMPQTSGTLAYMSPEQARGLQVDARSDLYSAAAVFVEMLTGEAYLPLAGADQFQARAMILEKTPTLDLPAGAMTLTGFVLKSLSKSPAERYHSAGEMLAALDAAFVG